MARPLRGLYARGHDRIPEAGAVEVHDKAMPMRPAADVLDLFQRINPPAAAVMRVLQANDPRAHQVIVDAANLIFQLAQIKDAVLSVNGSTGNTTQHRGPAGFEVVDVTARF